jgi:hypothetical protein
MNGNYFGRVARQLDEHGGGNLTSSPTSSEHDMDDTISQKVRSHGMYDQCPACSRMADVHSVFTTPLSCTVST